MGNHSVSAIFSGGVLLYRASDSAAGAALSCNDEGCPARRMRLVGILRRSIDHGEDRAAQSLGTADRRLVGRRLDKACRQFDRRIRIDRPMGDEERAGTGIEERFGKA